MNESNPSAIKRDLIGFHGIFAPSLCLDTVQIYAYRFVHGNKQLPRLFSFPLLVLGFSQRCQKCQELINLKCLWWQNAGTRKLQLTLCDLGKLQTQIEIGRGRCEWHSRSESKPCLEGLRVLERCSECHNDKYREISCMCSASSTDGGYAITEEGSGAKGDEDDWGHNADESGIQHEWLTGRRAVMVYFGHPWGSFSYPVLSTIYDTMTRLK